MLIPLIVLNVVNSVVKLNISCGLNNYWLPKCLKFRFLLQRYLKLDFYEWKHRGRMFSNFDNHT